jgi:hypothetical protein
VVVAVVEPLVALEVLPPVEEGQAEQVLQTATRVPQVQLILEEVEEPVEVLLLQHHPVGQEVLVL